MIRINQTFLLLNDYVHIQVYEAILWCGHRLIFLPAEKETKTAILQAFGSL